MENNDKDSLDSTFKQNIFEQIISDLYNNYQFKDEEEFKSFLLKHKPIMEDLANKIRKRGQVNLNYKDHKLQISYVLRYFHSYWYQIYYSLKKIKELQISFFSSNYSTFRKNTHDQSEGVLKVGLFGAGPAPEIIGITKFIEHYKNSIFTKLKGSMTKKFSIDLLDQEKAWDFSRETFIFSNGKKKKLKQLGINVNSKTFDFSDFSYFETLRENSYDLIYFQNCVNEFVEYSDQEESKYNKVLKALRPGGLIIFSERSITETVTFIDWFDITFNDEKNYSLLWSKRSTLTNEAPDGPPAFDGITYNSSGDSPTPEILLRGNFYSSSEHPMHNNNFDSYILKKAELVFTLEDLENIKFFKIEDHDIDFIPINPMSPYNHLIGSYEKIEFIRSKRISNINRNIPFNSGLPNSILENKLINSWRKQGKSIQEIIEYFQRGERAIRGILKER